MPITRDTIKKRVVDTLKEISTLPDIDEAPQTDSSIIEKTIAAKDLPIEGLKQTFTNNNQVINIYITGLYSGTLYVKLIHSNPHANIRISQIIMPNGSSDGPFGRELKYKITQRGDYNIIIKKSNMASGSEVGDVFLNISN